MDMAAYLMVQSYLNKLSFDRCSDVKSTEK